MSLIDLVYPRPDRPVRTAENSPQREEFADFALVLKDGRELKCHKFRLAEVSPFFCAMLRQDCIETQTNKMKVSEFEPETVESFVDWIYAEMEVMKVTYRIECQKIYAWKRLTPDLLRLSHMYQVKTLEDACLACFLTYNHIKDDNAAEIWTVAEMIGQADLKGAVLRHFGKKQDKLVEVPGMKECFKNPQMMESLVTYLSGREKVVTVTVECHTSEQELLTTQQVRVKLSDTVKGLRLRINHSLENWTHAGRAYRCKSKTIGNEETIALNYYHGLPLNFFPEHCTLDEIGYTHRINWTDGLLLECIISPSDNDGQDDGQDDGHHYD